MKQKSQILKVALAALVLAVAAPGLRAAPPETGIQGYAALYVSYGAPVEVEPGVWVGPGDVMMPVATSFSVLSAHSGHEVGRFATDANGEFTLSLPPGRYVIVPNALTFPFGCSVPAGSFEVTVRAKEFAPALILYYQDGPCGIFSAGAP